MVRFCTPSGDRRMGYLVGCPTPDSSVLGQERSSIIVLLESTPKGAPTSAIRGIQRHSTSGPAGRSDLPTKAFMPRQHRLHNRLTY
jgi:hypothetical protein